MLLKKGADPTLVDKDFKTALHWAVQVRKQAVSLSQIEMMRNYVNCFLNRSTNESGNYHTQS